MNRLTVAERRALTVLLVLVMALAAARWWQTRQTTLKNRDNARLEPAREAPPYPPPIEVE